jgi:hypothetical protein
LTSFSGSFESYPSCPAEFLNVKMGLLPERSKREPMNILLQNKRTLNYVQGATGWTPDHEKARVFSTGLEAMFFCLNGRIANMQIFGEFADARMNFTIPVTDLRGD